MARRHGILFSPSKKIRESDTNPLLKSIAAQSPNDLNAIEKSLLEEEKEILK